MAPSSRFDSRQKSRICGDFESKLATAAGFRLVAESQVNANPKDKADYPNGVWTLPPTLTEGEKDRARYLAIGESDHMTLKFVKPCRAPASRRNVLQPVP